MLSLEYLTALSALCRRKGLALHMDGAHCCVCEQAEVENMQCWDTLPPLYFQQARHGKPAPVSFLLDQQMEG